MRLNILHGLANRRCLSQVEEGPERCAPGWLYWLKLINYIVYKGMDQCL